MELRGTRTEHVLIQVSPMEAAQAILTDLLSRCGAEWLDDKNRWVIDMSSHGSQNLRVVRAATPAEQDVYLHVHTLIDALRALADERAQS